MVQHSLHLSSNSGGLWGVQDLVTLMDDHSPSDNDATNATWPNGWDSCPAIARDIAGRDNHNDTIRVPSTRHHETGIIHCLQPAAMIIIKLVVIIHLDQWFVNAECLPFLRPFSWSNQWLMKKTCDWTNLEVNNGLYVICDCLYLIVGGQYYEPNRTTY